MSAGRIRQASESYVHRHFAVEAISYAVGLVAWTVAFWRLLPGHPARYPLVQCLGAAAVAIAFGCAKTRVNRRVRASDRARRRALYRGRPLDPWPLAALPWTAGLITVGLLSGDWWYVASFGLFFLAMLTWLVIAWHHTDPIAST